MSRHHDVRNLELIATLAELYRARLSVALAGARDVAVLDFPNYPNVGDSLIWLGQLAALRALDVRVAYRSTAESFSWRQLERRLSPEAPLLFSGGGNLGDLYPRIQSFRMRVLREGRNRRFIQLPQSIHFRSDAAAEQFFEVTREHPSCLLLVRDQESANLAANHSVRATLCPDAAFCFGPLPARQANRAVGLLLRTDDERADHFGPLLANSRGDAVDWITVPHPGLQSFLYDLTFIASSRRSFPIVAPLLRPIYASLARARLATGMDLLARSEVLVTDRLHGHILATLMGIPHVLLDNSYGKLGRFHRDWTSASPYAFRANVGESLEEVCMRARSAGDQAIAEGATGTVRQDSYREPF